MVEELEMVELFDSELRIAPVTSLRALESVLDEVQLLQEGSERRQFMSDVNQAFQPRTRDEQTIYGETKLSIGVKKLLNLTEMARLDPGQVGARLVSSLIDQASGGAAVPQRRRKTIPSPLDGEMSPEYYPGITM